MARDGIALPDGYPEFLGSLKQRVRDAQLRAQRTSIRSSSSCIGRSVAPSFPSRRSKDGVLVS